MVSLIGRLFGDVKVVGAVNSRKNKNGQATVEARNASVANPDAFVTCRPWSNIVALKNEAALHFLNYQGA